MNNVNKDKINYNKYQLKLLKLSIKEKMLTLFKLYLNNQEIKLKINK